MNRLTIRVNDSKISHRKEFKSFIIIPLSSMALPLKLNPNLCVSISSQIII
jgi:hypothetical protein